MTKTIRVLSILFLLIIFLRPTAISANPQSAADFQPAKKLIVGVLNDPPYIIKGKNGEWTGLNVDIWKSVARELNVDYEFKEMKFQELLDALKNNKLDISIDAFFVLAEREKLIDYSFAFGNTRLAVATLPEKIGHPWLTAMKIIISWGTLKVLGLLCLALCVLGFILWLIERKSNPDHFGGGKIKGIGSGVYWVGSTLASGVCFGVALKSFAARILGLIWMLLCAVALSALIASLSASLSASRSMVEVVGDEMLRNMHLGGVEASAATPELKNLGGEYTLYQDGEGALKAVLGGEIDGFLYDEITLHYYKENDYRDEISVYPTSLKRFSFAFGLPSESPLRKEVNYALLDLMEKPDWSFLLKRYGLEENYEARQAVGITGRKGLRR